MMIPAVGLMIASAVATVMDAEIVETVTAETWANVFRCASIVDGLDKVLLATVHRSGLVRRWSMK